MDIEKTAISKEIKEKLSEKVKGIIDCINETHKDLGPGMPSYVYSESLYRDLREHGFEPERDYQHHPMFRGQRLNSYLKMDIMVPMEDGDIIIECKTAADLGMRDQYQIYGDLRGTEFPIALLVNFGTWPDAQIQRFYFDKEAKFVNEF